jgi:Ca2+-binding EF-hand superfamily protein
MASRSKRSKEQQPPPPPPSKPRKPVGISSLSREEKEQLLRETGLDERELQALDIIYSRNVMAGSDTPPVEKLRDLPESSVVPLFQRILQKYNTDHSGMISFAEFARALSSLSPRATLEEKLRFAFSLFDLNGTGTVEAVEVFGLLRLMMGYVHDDRDLQLICANYMRRFPDGAMGFEDFCQMIDAKDLDKLIMNL